ncbi:MAG: DUF642 domain-containing protein [Gemmatimonadaceae bacterium]|nr:DUF642 domain-containing protein [Gemmatimonadaceae bacterium]
MLRRFAVLAVPLLFAACADRPSVTEPEASLSLAAADRSASTTNSYASGSTPVTAYDPIIPTSADPTWPTTSCTATPQVGLNANWQNPHAAFSGFGHPWLYDYFTGADWINAWDNINSRGPGGQSWTKYSTSVQGNGTFQIQLLADNCSWVYLDGTLVGVQNTNLAANTYGLTLNGTHELAFIIFDGGGAAGGKFKLSTTSNPPPPLNPDLDADGRPNDSDAFPLDPLRQDASNLIANGSFERPAVPVSSWPTSVAPWITLTGTNLPGWTVTSGAVEVQRGEMDVQFTGVPDGLQGLDLNTASISQAITTRANYRYRVSFKLSKNYVCVGGTTIVRVSLGNATQDFSFDDPSGGYRNMRWDAKSMEATASSASSALQITSIAAGGCGGAMLDMVSVEEIGPGDQTPPVIVPTVTGAQQNGWYTSNIGISWAVSDAESAISASTGCDASSVTTDTDGTTFTCSATSLGGTSSSSVTVRRDATAPTIAPSVIGTMGSGGWYTSSVNVSWAVTDATSGIASAAGCDASTLSSDNAGVTYTCTATDHAGQSSTRSVTVKRDATGPAIAFVGNAGSYTVDQTVAITCAASDAMSGLATSTCPNVSGDAYSFAAGPNTINASASDRAGNASAATATFTIAVTDGSLCALVERFVTSKGVANSFCVKLRVKSYDAFRNELSAQGGKKFLSSAHAAILLRLVNLLG